MRWLRPVLVLALLLGACSIDPSSPTTSRVPIRPTTTTTTSTTAPAATTAPTTTLAPSTTTTTTLPLGADLQWQQVTFTGARGLPLDVAVIDGALVAIGEVVPANTATMWRSADASTWLRVENQPAFGDAGSLHSIGSWEGGVAAAGLLAGDVTETVVLLSPDGANWESVTLGSLAAEPTPLGDRALELTSLVSWEGGLVLVGRERDGPATWRSAVALSADGSNWERVSPGDPVFGGGIDQEMNAVTVFDGALVAVGRTAFGAGVWISSDGAEWERVTEGPEDPDPALRGVSLHMNDVVSWNGTLVAAGSDGFGDDEAAAVWLSDDGRSWRRASDPDGALRGPDGITISGLAAWDGGLVAVGGSFRQVVRHDGDTVAVTTEEHVTAVWVSEDGDRWLRVPPPDDADGADQGMPGWMQSVAAWGGGFVIVGSSGPGNAVATVWSLSPP